MMTVTLDPSAKFCGSGWSQTDLLEELRGNLAFRQLDEGKH